MLMVAIASLSRCDAKGLSLLCLFVIIRPPPFLAHDERYHSDFGGSNELWGLSGRCEVMRRSSCVRLHIRYLCDFTFRRRPSDSRTLVDAQCGRPGWLGGHLDRRYSIARPLSHCCCLSALSANFVPPKNVPDTGNQALRRVMPNQYCYSIGQFAGCTALSNSSSASFLCNLTGTYIDSLKHCTTQCWSPYTRSWVRRDVAGAPDLCVARRSHRSQRDVRHHPGAWRRGVLRCAVRFCLSRILHHA